MVQTVAVSGASGRTGFRVVEELLETGISPRLLIRQSSVLQDQRPDLEQIRLDLFDSAALDAALQGVDALVIATGARPSVDLTGPLRVDAWGVQRQVEACRRVGVRRVILVSSLCAGRLWHPLNLFGLILLWKRVGERALVASDLDWTVIRPGGLSERERDLDREAICWSGADQQTSDSIPRRLVARCCVEALNTPASIGHVLEITSRPGAPSLSLAEFLDK